MITNDYRTEEVGELLEPNEVIDMPKASRNDLGGTADISDFLSSVELKWNKHRENPGRRNKKWQTEKTSRIDMEGLEVNSIVILGLMLMEY